MVGIPGKSKGCNTCRRRKKGCDLQRPACGQCRKLGLVCGGYARDTVWVNVTPGAVPVRSRSPHPATAAAQSEITLADTLVRTAYHEKYLGMFWSSYLPNGRNFPPESVEYTSGVWMNDLHRLFRTGNQLALKKIMLAIAVTGVGEHDDNSWMVEKGIALYGDALATLAALLETRDDTVRENNFVTTKLLSLYEILYGHKQQDRLYQIKSWYLHLQGELGLIAASGPEAYATGFAHQLFIDGRGTQISYSLASRTPTFLNEPAWKTVPWKYHPKMAKDLLGDIFAEIPGLLGELDAVRALLDPGLRELERQSLASKCRRIEADWLTWGCESAPPKSLAGTLDTMQAGQIFDHLIAAHIMSSYYATGVFLYSVLGHATGCGTSEGPGGLSMPRMLCRKMLEIIPAFLNPHAGKWGVHGAIFPSIVIITYVEEVDEGIPPTEKDALYKLFSQGKNGRTIQRFVDNMLDRLRSRDSHMFS